MVYRSEIEKALDEMIADEAGMKFQGLAVVLAKQKWPQLVACERKWDKGLDALIENIEWRREWAEKVGLGFKLPSLPLSIGQLGQLFEVKTQPAKAA